MKKKFIVFILLVFGVVSVLPATDQIFFDVTGGVNFYGTVGGRIGWMRYWNNEKIGLITGLSYHGYKPMPYVPEGEVYEGSIYHNIGLGAGVVFNNMGMNGTLRTMQYIKLKGIVHIWDDEGNNDSLFTPWLDLGFKLNIFFNNRIALSTGIGAELTWSRFPHFYLSLGMKYAL